MGELPFLVKEGDGSRVAILRRLFCGLRRRREAGPAWRSPLILASGQHHLPFLTPKTQILAEMANFAVRINNSNRTAKLS
eukprot:scaffold22813_cov78-Cyclotella_meneghiniana.AAC.15